MPVHRGTVVTDALMNYSRLLRADEEDATVWVEPVEEFFTRTEKALRGIAATCNKAAQLTVDLDRKEMCRSVAEECVQLAALCEAAQRLGDGDGTADDKTQLRKWLWDPSPAHSGGGRQSVALNRWLGLRQSGMHGIVVRLKVDEQQRILAGCVVRAEPSLDGGEWTPVTGKR